MLTTAPIDCAGALERCEHFAWHLSGEVVLLPVTPAGRLDNDALRATGCKPLEPGAEFDPARLGVLVDGFTEILPGAPPGVSVVVLDAGGTPEFAQSAGPAYQPAVVVTQDALRLGRRLERNLPPRQDVAPDEWRDFSVPPLPRLPPAANDNSPNAPKRERFTLTWFDEIAEAAPRRTFVNGVLGDGEFTVVSGLPGSGKSVILTDLACHVAAGMEWMGRRVRQGLVVYVAAERKALTERRMIAFRKRHALTGSVPLLVLGGKIDLTSSTADAAALAAVVRGAAECGHAPAWIILDTLTRTFGPGDQNTSKDMGRYIASVDVLLQTGAHVSVVHHTAWSGERAKGAIDLDGAVDASFLVKKEGDTHLLTCDGTNDGHDGPVCRFRMEGVEVGTDESGEPTMAPVVVPAEDMAAGFVANLKGYAASAMDALLAAVADEGVEPDGPQFPDDILVVSEDAWRSRFYAMFSGTSTNTLKQRFARAKAPMLASGAVRQSGEWFWPGGT